MLFVKTDIIPNFVYRSALTAFQLSLCSIDALESRSREVGVLFESTPDSIADQLASIDEQAGLLDELVHFLFHFIWEFDIYRSHNT